MRENIKDYTINCWAVNGTGIAGIFSQLNEEGYTVVMVTHDSSIADFARRKIVMKDGQIVA
nr:hypothetical protein [Flexistipes sinusarabici]